MVPFSSMTARFAVLSFVFGLSQATCYYPDGSSDSGHSPCSSGGASVCCAEGFQCLSNGFCNDSRYDNFERVLRGGCTDKDWGSGCPQTCTSIWPQGDEAVYVCGSGKACCGRTDDCCSDSSVSKFDFGSPQVIAVAGDSLAEGTSAKQEDAPSTTAQQTQQQQTEQQQTQQQQTTQQTKPQQTQAPATSKEEDQEPSTTANHLTATSKLPATSITKDTSVGDPSKAATASDRSETSAKPATVTLVSDRTRTQSAATESNAPPSSVTNNYVSSSPNNTLPIAIGVSVGVGVLLFLCIIVGCWYVRRKKRRQPLVDNNTYYEIGDTGPAVVARDDKHTKVTPYFAGSGPVFELDGYKAVELSTGVDAKELDGNASTKDFAKPNFAAKQV